MHPLREAEREALLARCSGCKWMAVADGGPHCTYRTLTICRHESPDRCVDLVACPLDEEVGR